MTRTKTIQVTYYKFNELSDEAKENARNWYREILQFEPYYDDFIEVANILGINVINRDVRLFGGGKRKKPCINYSLYPSYDGDASFEGSHSYKAGCVQAIKEYAPLDAELHSIAARLEATDQLNEHDLITYIMTNRRSNTLSFTTYNPKDESEGLASDALISCFKDFAHWLYKQIKNQYNYEQSDEVVNESIECNEYEFDIDGTRIY